MSDRTRGAKRRLKIGVVLAALGAVALTAAACDVKNGYIVQDGKRLGEMGSGGAAVAVLYRQGRGINVPTSQIALDIYKNHVRNGDSPSVAAVRTLRFLRGYCAGNVERYCLRATSDREGPDFLDALRRMAWTPADCLAINFNSWDQDWTTRPAYDEACRTDTWGS